MSHERLTVRGHGAVPEARRAELELSLAGIRSLGDLLEWGKAQDPTVHIDEIVTQDEYTHDVLVGIPASLWMAFDVT